MPLFMDIHTVDSDAFTVEDVVKAHMEDLAIQDKFGVKQLKYWVNVDAKTIFCLMEGPDKEACNEVHKQSHGNTACNIIEVSDDEYNLYLGIGKDHNDLAQTEAGEIDTGYRTILLMNYIDVKGNFSRYVNIVNKIIEQHNGVLIVQPNNAVMATFIFASDAINCSKAIKKALTPIPDDFEFVMALASGRPVDEKGDNLFEETKQKVRHLCALGLLNTIYIDAETKTLSQKEHTPSAIQQTVFYVVGNEEFKFLYHLYTALESNLYNASFKSSSLPSILGHSKSKAYRKISSLTGMAPNQLIQEMRLRKSLNRIIQDGCTIAEIAYGLGFNSSTYFAKVFKKRYHIQPTLFARQHS